MKHIIRAIILIIILWIAAVHYRYNDNVTGVIGVLFIMAFIYLIAGIIGAVRRSIKARNKTIPAETTAANKNTGCSWLLLIFLLLALTYTFRSALGVYSAKAIHFMDSLLQLANGVSPVISWGLLGLLVGSVYGSFVGSKKYKVNATANLVPVGALILFVAILYLINKPLDATASEPLNNTQTIFAYNLVTAEVYNTSPDDNKAMYKHSYLLDSNDRTAWIMDVSRGNAEIRLSFKGLENYANKDVQCTGFMIKNGYRKSPQIWDNFARVKALAIKHNGRFITAAIINDKNSDSEEIKISPVAISSFDNISININAVYPGEKYPNRVAITELVPIIQYKKE